MLVDARTGPKDSDLSALDLLGQAAVPTQVVLTKVDKVTSRELDGRILDLERELSRRPAAADHVVPVSALKATGIPELRARLAALAGPR